jgi:hypothetical protein
VPAAPAAAETSVDPNGNVVTITIPVDLVGAEGKTNPDGTMSLVDFTMVGEKTRRAVSFPAASNFPFPSSLTCRATTAPGAPRRASTGCAW